MGLLYLLPNISTVLSRLHSGFRDTQKEKEVLHLDTVSIVGGERVVGGLGGWGTVVRPPRAAQNPRGGKMNNLN